MFWRFGLVLERRPVVVATWLKVVWMPAGLGVDQLGQGVEVGVLQLRQLAPALDLGDDLVLVADLGEHPGVGREARLAAALLGQAELVEEDLAELLRRADRELVAGELEDLALELGDSLRHALADLRQALGVELARRRAPSRPAPRSAASRRRSAGARARTPRGARAGGRRARSPGGRRWRDRAPPRPPRRKRQLAVGVCSRRSRREAGVRRELVEVVGAARRVDQVGGDHRVVLRGRGCPGRRRPAGRRARRRRGLRVVRRSAAGPRGSPRARPGPRRRR